MIINPKDPKTAIGALHPGRGWPQEVDNANKNLRQRETRQPSEVVARNAGGGRTRR